MRSAKILVVGCGGLGGYVCEYLVRIGVGHIIAADGDVFCESNMNRQLLCTPQTIGRNKAECARERALLLRPDIDFTAVCEYMSTENVAELVSDCDLVIDALDNVESRRLLFDECKRRGVSLVHGAVGERSFQVGVLTPETEFPELMPMNVEGERIMAYTPSACASFQCAMAEKILRKQATGLEGKLLCTDLETNESIVFELT